MNTNDLKNSNDTQNRPQVKICGLTRIDEAQRCAELGADAIGFVFFEKSPRNVTEKQAKEIILSLPSEIKKVGVFVNESFSFIMQKVENCGLDVVQLHGNETPELTDKLIKENLTVIKALFSGGKPSFDHAEKYTVSAFLVECAKGVLPGGNAMTWNWEEANSLAGTYPLVLAGGLRPENIQTALVSCLPDAVDISSGVEKSPGRKDLDKVKAFLESVSRAKEHYQTERRKLRRIF